MVSRSMNAFDQPWASLRPFKLGISKRFIKRVRIIRWHNGATNNEKTLADDYIGRHNGSTITDNNGQWPTMADNGHNEASWTSSMAILLIIKSRSPHTERWRASSGVQTLHCRFIGEPLGKVLCGFLASILEQKNLQRRCLLRDCLVKILWRNFS